MEQSARPPAIVEMEIQVLRVMCQGAAGVPLRAEGAAILAGYRFREPAHQVVFDVLRAIATQDAERIREQLPARLNNRGFPDPDLENFFQPHSLTPGEALALMQTLAALPVADATSGSPLPRQGP